MNQLEIYHQLKLLLLIWMFYLRMHIFKWRINPQTMSIREKGTTTLQKTILDWEGKHCHLQRNKRTEENCKDQKDMKQNYQKESPLTMPSFYNMATRYLWKQSFSDKLLGRRKNEARTTLWSNVMYLKNESNVAGRRNLRIICIFSSKHNWHPQR